jgi:hypothetical protein
MLPAAFETIKARFLEDLAKFQVTRAHAIPDLVLLGFLNEVEENARATSIVGTSDLPHRGFPNARAAFEAAQLALLLVTDPEYDRAGARAWVYYLRKDRRFREMHPEEFRGLDRLTPAEWFRSAVHEMAEVWNDLDSGKGQLILDAESLVESQPRRPDNWAALPIAPTLRDRLADYSRRHNAPVRSDAAEVYNRAYAALSRESHPRTRLRPIQVRGHPNGHAEFDFEERDLARDAETAVVLATASLSQGCLALAIRHFSLAV